MKTEAETGAELPHTKKGLGVPEAEGGKEGFSSAAFRGKFDFILLASRTERE